MQKTGTREAYRQSIYRFRVCGARHSYVYGKFREVWIVDNITGAVSYLGKLPESPIVHGAGGGG